MAAISVTNKTAAVVALAFGPLLPGQTRNFGNLTTAQLQAEVAELNAKQTAGLIDWCSVVDGTGLNQGADVQNQFGSVTANVVNATTLNVSGGGSLVTNPLTGNFTISQPIGQQFGFQVYAPGLQNGVSNGLWTQGYIYVADPTIGLQAIKTLYQADGVPQHTVMSVESRGTQSMVGFNDQRSRYEHYDIDGQVNPTARWTTYPSCAQEYGMLVQVVPVGSMSRSGTTVTVTQGNHGYYVGQVISLTCGDTRFPGGTNAFTVTSTSDGNHFTYTDSGSGTATNNAQGIFSAETCVKLRLVGDKHLQLVMGPYNSEFVCIEWYADSMVTAAGYGASYGGSVIYQPTTLTGAYSLQAGSTYLCDATAGAWAFTLPANGNYFSKPGRTIRAIKTDSSANAVTVTAPSGVTVGAASTYALTAQRKYVELYCDGKGGSGGNDTWYVVGSN